VKISFVVPVYRKKPEQLRKCLSSLFEQSHKNIEVVCVFDGPDSELEAVVAEFPAVIKKVVEHGGAPKARNAGLKEATGDAVCFWDADCYAVPEMVRTWVQYFEDVSRPDFLYSGYKWSDPTKPGFESEPFNPWLLKKYNYISTMSPIRKEKAIEWDETLVGLQDWDYFRRLVDSGARGMYVPCGHNAVAAGWETDFPDQDSISGVKNREKSVERINAVREKHGDPKPDILVYGTVMKHDAVNVARQLDADYFNSAFWITREYKACLMIGFNPFEMDQALSFAAASGPNSKKIIYWMGLDAELVAQGPYSDVKKLAAGIKKHINVNLCPDVKTQSVLEDIGLKAEILMLPLATGKVLTDMPTDFQVMVFSDNEYMPLADSIIKAMPDVEFDKFEEGKEYPYSKYSMVLYLVQDGRLMTPVRNMLIHGRHIVSNAQEPFAGYIDPSNITKFKEEAIARIREVQANHHFNKDAQDYYLDVMSVERFKEQIMNYVNAPALEVIHA